MTPLRLSTTWYRRLYEVIFLSSLVIIALFVLHSASLVTLPHSLQINSLALIGAGLSLLGSIVGFIFAKQVKSFAPALMIYLIFSLTIAWLVYQTGLTSSPFIILWALTSLAAAMFAVAGWIPILALNGLGIVIIYLSGHFNVETVAIIILSGIVPLVAGILLWREQPEANDEASRNAKNLATELSEVANKSEIIINAIGDGVIAIDGKGVIGLINPAAQEILGWVKQDSLLLNYKSILKLMDENNHELDPAHDPIQQVLNTNQQSRANKLSAETKSGKKISLSLVVSPIGQPGSGVIAVFRDTTKERAEEREQAEFISTASHEMRTPVASIEGYLGLALNPSTAQIDDRARDFINKAHESAQHLGRLFQDLLDVSKSEDGRMASLPKVVDAIVFTQSVLNNLTPTAELKGLKVIFKPSEAAGQKKIMPVYFVNQDPDHMREILDNLIENAIKYTPKGEVTVDVTGSDDKVIISVQDTGLGIPGEDIPHLFQKFYRIDNVDRQEIGGTGLGLFLSRRLAESMEGRLWVESTYGQGSTFFLELPRVGTEQASILKQQQDQQAALNAQQAPAAVAQATAPATAQVPPTTPNEAPVQPAATVPRGESLTREQIAERVKQLETMARQQRQTPPAERQ